MPSATSFDVAQVVRAVRAIPGDQAVVLVFATESYSSVVRNWLRFARRAGAGRILLIALGENAAGMGPANGVPQVMIPGPLGLNQLWVLRAKIFAALAAAGIDFIHSDADAVWVRSPFETLRVQNVDLAFTCGTGHPRAALEAWGFVLCCGFFAVRGTSATAEFLEAVAVRAQECGDDQQAVNDVVLGYGMQWNYPPARGLRWSRGITFSVFDTAVKGRCANGLSVSLLPHAKFPRLPEIGPDTIVAHPLTPQTDSRLDPNRFPRFFEALGLWDPEGLRAAG